MTNRSAAQRLVVCFLVLAAVDQAVIPVLYFSESRHYKSAAFGRFPNSDLFPLGPLVEYLEENPIGPKPRAAFLGDSRVWGYRLKSEETIPAAFQRLAPEMEALNLGINSFKEGSNYLITKRLLGSVDFYYLFFQEGLEDQQAHPLLPKLIRVDPEDAAWFHFQQPSKIRIWLDRLADHWRLSRYSYRLQAAWFGTSARQACYLSLKNLLLARSAKKQVPERTPVEAASAAAFYEVPMDHGMLSPEEVKRLAQCYPLLWKQADLFARHDKRGFFIEFSNAPTVMPKQDAALFNAYFHPSALVVRLVIPKSWYMDEQSHVTAEGAAGVARLLAQLTQESSKRGPE